MAKESKDTTHDAPEATKNEADAPSEPKLKRRRNINSLFWGLLLVGVGALALLDSLNVLEVDFFNLWRLWPLIIVGIGLSLLTLRGWLGGLVTAFFILLSLASMIYVTAIDTPSRTDTSVQSVTVDADENVDDMRVNIKGGGGKLTLSSEAESTYAVQADIDSSFTGLEESTRIEDGTQIVDISLNNSARWWQGHWRNDMRVRFTDELPLDVAVDVGAAQIEADLSATQLRNLTFKTGASDLELTLGGEEPETNVEIEAGASNIVIRVPDDAGIHIESGGGLSNADFADLRQVNGGYETEDFADADTKITINADIGLSNLQLERY